MKTYANWKGDLGEYLQVGDEVDQEMVDYFINVLPPVTMNGECVQMGEPYDHREDSEGRFRGRYSTLVSVGFSPNRRWFYAGYCFGREWQKARKEIMDKMEEATE